MEKELFAIIKILKRHRTLLFNNTIHVKTDNKNLIFNGNTISRINRRKETLVEFNIDLMHIMGSENLISGELSRNLPKIITVKNSIKTFHENHGHPGILRTYKSFQKICPEDNYTYSKVSKTISACEPCQQNVSSKHKYGKTFGFLLSDSPFLVLSSDIVGPFRNMYYNIEPESGSFYLLTITDIFSRFTQITSLKIITSQEIIKKAFKPFFKSYGTPNKILTDNETQYVSTEF